MSDYIKREDAIFVALQQPLYSVVSQIKQLEGIDIVRCKECKWWVVAMNENNTDEDYLKCNMDKWTNADDYCSYGERSKQ